MPKHRASTLFVRVPTKEWPTVVTGKAREFRIGIGNTPRTLMSSDAVFPVLAVCYRRRRASFDYRLMTLEGIRQEMLGAITEDGLALAGYEGRDALARFRRDWSIRNHRLFEPLLKMTVFTVRPFTPGDLSRTGESLVKRLYGEFLDGEEKSTRSPRTLTQ